MTHNIIAYNTVAQLWGWFDTRDEREWPEQTQKTPNELSLETLRLTLANNFYARRDDQGLFHWGVDWARHVYYVDLARVGRDLNLENSSRVGDVSFVNANARDFRLTKANSALRQNYPRGKIPGVVTGNARAK